MIEYCQYSIILSLNIVKIIGLCVYTWLVIHIFYEVWCYNDIYNKYFKKLIDKCINCFDKFYSFVCIKIIILLLGVILYVFFATLLIFYTYVETVHNIINYQFIIFYLIPNSLLLIMFVLCVFKIYLCVKYFDLINRNIINILLLFIGLFIWFGRTLLMLDYIELLCNSWWYELLVIMIGLFTSTLMCFYPKFMENRHQLNEHSLNSDGYSDL